MPIAELPADPCTISMHTRRTFFPAALAPQAFRAGVIASRNGSASVTPIPFRTVRRERCLFVRYIASPFLISRGARHFSRRRGPTPGALAQGCRSLMPRMAAGAIPSFVLSLCGVGRHHAGVWLRHPERGAVDHAQAE